MQLHDTVKRNFFLGGSYLSPDKHISHSNHATLNREHYEANELTIQKFMLTSISKRPWSQGKLSA